MIRRSSAFQQTPGFVGRARLGRALEFHVSTPNAGSGPCFRRILRLTLLRVRAALHRRKQRKRRETLEDPSSSFSLLPSVEVCPVRVRQKETKETKGNLRSSGAVFSGLPGASGYPWNRCNPWCLVLSLFSAFSAYSAVDFFFGSGRFCTGGSRARPHGNCFCGLHGFRSFFLKNHLTASSGTARASGQQFERFFPS